MDTPSELPAAPILKREATSASLNANDDKDSKDVPPAISHVKTVDSDMRIEIDRMHTHRKLSGTSFPRAADHAKAVAQDQEADVPCSYGRALFIGIGGGLAAAGPIGLLIAATWWSVIVFCAAQCQVETVTQFPMDASTIRNAHRMIDPAVGVATGWNYFLQQAFYICYESTAVASLMNYWIPGLNAGVFVTVSLLIFFALNIWRADLFGEAEFWIAINKFILSLGLMIYTLVVMCGGNPKGDAFGFRNWVHAQIAGESAGWRFGNILSCLLVCSGCIGGPEYLSMVAGEVEAPRHVLPRSFRTVVYRFFFMGGALCVSILVAYDDPALTGGGGDQYVSASPYIASMINLNIKVLPDIFNALVITSIISAGNSYTFGASRSLHGMALDGSAPAFFKWRNRHGTPWTCVLAAMAVGLISYLAVDKGTEQVLTWILAVSAGTACVTFSIMAITWLRLDAAIKAQGHQRETYLQYYSRWQPWSAYITLIGAQIIQWGGPWAVFANFKGTNSGLTLFFSYGIVFIDIGIFLIYKFVTQSRFYTGSSVRSKFWRGDEVDLRKDLDVLDAYEAEWYAQREARPLTRTERFVDKVF